MSKRFEWDYHDSASTMKNIYKHLVGMQNHLVVEEGHKELYGSFNHLLFYLRGKIKEAELKRIRTNIKELEGFEQDVMDGKLEL